MSSYSYLLSLLDVLISMPYDEMCTCLRDPMYFGSIWNGQVFKYEQSEHPIPIITFNSDKQIRMFGKAVGHIIPSVLFSLVLEYIPTKIISIAILNCHYIYDFNIIFSSVNDDGWMFLEIPNISFTIHKKTYYFQEAKFMF